MATSPLIPASLERFLQVATARVQTVAANMANIDTPGYRTKDINFEHEMQRATLDASAGTLGGAEMMPVVQQVQGLLERPDGNNVNLDRESLLLSQTQLQYQLGIQLVKSEFHTMFTAIKEGS